MKTKNIIKLMCLFALSLQLVSCGPSLLSDEEFAESAREVCSTLKSEITSIISISHMASDADAYRRAANTLADLEITEESAPQGTRLRSGLVELADSLDKVAVPLSEAIASTGVKNPYNVFFVADGSVIVFHGDISDMRKVVIEADLMLELLTAKDLVREAAISLELEECVIE